MKNKEIAKLLNISPATVSMVLNNKPGISESTRKRVFETQKNSLMLTLGVPESETGRSQTIQLCILKSHGQIIGDTPFFMNLTEILHREANKKGYRLMISYFLPNMILDDYVLSLNESDSDGFLLLATEARDSEVARFCSLSKPVIVLDGWFPQSNLICVLMDNMAGIDYAMQHAYEKGHRKIGFIRNSFHSNNLEERYWAYRNCLNKLELSYDPGYVLTACISEDHKYGDLVEQLSAMSTNEMPTLFVACNDVAAMEAIDAAKRLGYSIPEELSFIGFDDMPTLQYLSPSMTSLHLNIEAIAQMSFRLLLDEMRKKTNIHKSMRCLIGVFLVKRASVKEIEQVPGKP